MTLRERIEEVVRIPHWKNRFPCQITFYSLDSLHEFIDALCRAVQEAPPSAPSICPHGCTVTATALCEHPKPSREDLIRIIGANGFDVKIQQAGQHVHPWERLIDVLLAWARGEPTEPKWCAHWFRIGNSWRCTVPSIEGQQMFAQEDMRFCCWCGAPRPPETP